jgi:hypothetical protein
MCLKDLSASCLNIGNYFILINQNISYGEYYLVRITYKGFIFYQVSRYMNQIF